MCIEMGKPNPLKPQRGDMCIERVKLVIYKTALVNY